MKETRFDLFGCNSSTGYSISRNTESQQSGEPDKFQGQKLSTVAKEGYVDRLLVAPGSIAYSFARTIGMRQSTAKRDIFEVSFGKVEPQQSSEPDYSSL
jgi:hypothetical protein